MGKKVPIYIDVHFQRRGSLALITFSKWGGAPPGSTRGCVRKGLGKSPKPWFRALTGRKSEPNVISDPLWSGLNVCPPGFMR